jgi:hypothetical protein
LSASDAAFGKQAVAAALGRLAGTPRVVIYDIAEREAPQRPSPSSPFVRGPDAWWDYVARRRAFDDGQDLTLVISLRGLRAEERLLAVNWGTAYANALLLVEPEDPWLDLTTSEGIADFLKTRPYIRDAEALVRAAYAEWVYWYRTPEGEMENRTATLPVAEGATIWQVIWERLPQVFPEQAFLSSLTLLTLREAELFTGGREVSRAIIPFLTRLGLPVLYDGRHVLRAVRELVNAGLAWVQDPLDGWRVYRGPAEPIPAEVSDERLASMVR